MNRNVLIEMSGPPVGLDRGFDPARTSGVQVIETDHRNGTASAWLHPFYNKGCTARVGYLEHMGNLLPLLYPAGVESYFVYRDLWQTRLLG